MESDGMVIDPTISGVLRHSRLSRGTPSPLSDQLSVREEDVLRGPCRGLTNQEIAEQLHLAIDTVKHVVSAVLRKLDARDRTQVLIAFRMIWWICPPLCPAGAPDALCTATGLLTTLAISGWRQDLPGPSSPTPPPSPSPSPRGMPTV